MTVNLVIKRYLRYTLQRRRAFFMWKMITQDNIIYEDRDILVCRKPAGLAVQSAGVGTMDMESALKNYLALKNLGETPWLGIIHRLDQPVEGVLVFALTQKAAAGLNRQMEKKEIEKIYLAVTDQVPSPENATLEDWMKKDGRNNLSAVVKQGTKGAKKARLSYRVIRTLEDERTAGGLRCLTEIRLDTGRHHQIRVQMAHLGTPLLGDRKYYPEDNSGYSLGLCAYKLSFRHPASGKKMEFSSDPSGNAFAGLVV